jgi:hypothetical protein
VRDHGGVGTQGSLDDPYDLTVRDDECACAAVVPSDLGQRREHPVEDGVDGFPAERAPRALSHRTGPALLDLRLRQPSPRALVLLAKRAVMGNVRPVGVFGDQAGGLSRAPQIRGRGGPEARRT